MLISRKPMGSMLLSPHKYLSISKERELAAEFDIDLIESADIDQFRAELPNAEVVLMTPYARLTADDFPVMKRCRGVIRYGMGYDNIDVTAAAAAGIPVANVPGTASEEVASHALALGLALVRRLHEGADAISAGGWNGAIAYDTPKISELSVGVLGMGRIGHLLAQYWAALGASVKANDPFATFTDIPSASVEEILTGSDLISLHVPLTAETRHMISAETLASMKKGAVIVNVSRGGLIDEAALADALTSGHIGGAGLDVFSEEPLPADNVLRSAPRVILTPHIAWRSNRASAAVQEGAVARARLVLSGQPLIDVVN